MLLRVKVLRQLELFSTRHGNEAGAVGFEALCLQVLKALAKDLLIIRIVGVLHHHGDERPDTRRLRARCTCLRKNRLGDFIK